jgi:hypothetical protein
MVVFGSATIGIAGAPRRVADQRQARAIERFTPTIAAA